MRSRPAVCTDDPSCGTAVSIVTYMTQVFTNNYLKYAYGISTAVRGEHPMRSPMKHLVHLVFAGALAAGSFAVPSISSADPDRGVAAAQRDVQRDKKLVALDNKAVRADRAALDADRKVVHTERDI